MEHVGRQKEFPNKNTVLIGNSKDRGLLLCIRHSNLRSHDGCHANVNDSRAAKGKTRWAAATTATNLLISIHKSSSQNNQFTQTCDESLFFLLLHQ
jgi:hypothetical protein